MNAMQINYTEDEIQKLLENMELHLLIPRLVLENEWDSNGTRTYAFYVSRPLPKFNLPALYRMFREALLEEGLNPDGSTKVGGIAHISRPARKNLSLDEFYLSKGIIKGYKRVKGRRLTVRWKEKGITLMYWGRAVRMILFKGYSLNMYPVEFMYDLLGQLNYVKYLAIYALEQNREIRIRRFENFIREIKYKEATGWKISL